MLRVVLFAEDDCNIIFLCTQVAALKTFAEFLLMILGILHPLRFYGHRLQSAKPPDHSRQNLPLTETIVLLRQFGQ